VYFKKPVITIGFVVFATVFTFLPNEVIAEQYKGMVTQVIDGNTLVATVNRQKISIKLSYIEAPDLRQKFGLEAKQYVEKLALNKKVRIITNRSIKAPTTYAEVYVPTKSDPLNRYLVREGLAWEKKDKNNHNPSYALAESYAKRNKKGIWSQANPVFPSDFRKKEIQKKAEAKKERLAADEANAALSEYKYHDWKMQAELQERQEAERKIVEAERKKQEELEAIKLRGERAKRARLEEGTVASTIKISISDISVISKYINEEKSLLADRISEIQKMAAEEQASGEETAQAIFDARAESATKTQELVSVGLDIALEAYGSESEEFKAMMTTATETQKEFETLRNEALVKYETALKKLKKTETTWATFIAEIKNDLNELEHASDSDEEKRNADR